MVSGSKTGGGGWGDDTTAADNKDSQIRNILEEWGYNPNDSYKPVTAGTGTSGALYNQYTGGVIGTSGSTPGQYNQNANARLGDYEQDSQGNWNVVKNSPTDYVQRYVTSSAAPKQGLSIGDWFNAGKSALTSLFGLPSESDNTGEFAGKAVAGQVMSKIPGANVLWAAGNFLESLTEAQEEKNQDYLNQDFDYELAGEFYEDENGVKKFKPNYQKMASAGPESGSAVKTAADSSIIGVNMTADNKLDITVSPVFALSDRYKEALKNIKNTYGALTKAQADEVIDQDTGKTRLQTIEDYIRSEQTEYFYNAQVIRDIKNKAPHASDAMLNVAADTSKIGYYSEDQLDKVKVAIYNDNNKLEEVNAKEYLDSIKNMSKVERNDYMLKIGNRITSPDISDDEKAVLYAQSMALYAASDSANSPYTGMYQRDFLDEVGCMPEAFSGLSWNTFFGGTDLETFRQDELSSGALSLASTGASIYTLGKATNLLESGIRKIPGLSTLSEYTGESGKSAMETFRNTIADTNIAPIKAAGQYVAQTAGQVGFQLAADAVYDAAKIIPYALTGNIDEYDFVKELETDFLMDVLVTYGPRSFAEGMSRGGTKSEYRVAYENTKTGEIEYLRPKDAKKDSTYRIIESPDGARDVQLVKVTSEELAVRHAKAIDSLTDSNAALKVQELIFDKNAAMSKLAVQVRSVSDRYHYHKMLRYAADVRQVTEDTLAKFLTKDNVSTHWDAMRQVFREVAPKAKDLNKADQNYIKAVVNEARFLGKNTGDKNAEKTIKVFYKDAKNGVDTERAAQLDKLIGAMKDVASDVLDFYVEKGLMTDKDVAELRAQPGYEAGYLPMYMLSEVSGSRGGEVGQDRALYKRVRDAKALISIDDLDNPLNSLARYINNAMRAVAVNDRALAIREAASMSGVGIHLVEDTGGAMKDITTLKDFDEGFQKIYDNIVTKVNSSLPTYEQWQENNSKMVLRSNALKSAQKVQELQDESKQLLNENRRLQRQMGKADKEFSAVEGLVDSIERHTFNPIGTYRSDRGSKQRYKWYAFGLDAEASAKTYGKDAREYDISDKNVLDATGTLGAGTLYDILSRSGDPELDKIAEEFYQIPIGEDRIIINGDVLKQSHGAPVDKIFAELAKYGIDGFALNTRGLEELVVDTKASEGKRGDTITRAEYETRIEELSNKINSNRTLIAANKQQQLAYVDDMKRYTGNLMERAQKAHKGSDAKLDVKSYLDIQATNELKQALKTDNMVGQVQGILNRAIEAANPWVDPEVVIQRRAQAAAINYRNKVIKDLRAEARANKNAKGLNSDKINAAVDRAMDKVLEKLTGERKAEVTFIDDEGYATKLLDNYGDNHTIRYMLNGKEQRMVLDGDGSEQLVAEFYAPEFVTPKTALGKIASKLTRKGNEIAQLKRYLTTSADPSRVIPNIMRDWSRGIVSTGGQIVLSPQKYFAELAEEMGYTPEQTKIINNGLMLAREAVDNSTLTASLQMPSKNRDKSMVRAMTAPDGDGFVRYIYDVTETPGKFFSQLQDLGESFTRKRAMDVGYYQELAKAQAEGLDLDASIKRATEAAYFAGRESTVNFRRRGVLVGKIAQSVPYLTQKFATLQSFVYTYLNDPVGVSTSLKTTVSAYTALIAIALSNEESRKKYFMLTEYDRANNIIIPVDNGLIITMPLDETISAFLTPYRRMVESMNGLDPEAFYLCFGEGLAALNPFDLSGFSEGDKFNVQRGFEKLGAQLIPTWAQPIVETMTGRDLYYGTELAVDGEYTGSLMGVWDPTNGQMTTQSKNSKTLAYISDKTGIPQWILQNFYAEYGGNIGQYVLNTVDKLSGATEEQQGGKEWADSVFKPFTGLDSDQATNTFYGIIDGLKEEKTKAQAHLKTLTHKINLSGAEEKAELIKERQEYIEKYGKHVTDTIQNFLSAFEITGGLNKKQANQVWYLYKLYDEGDLDELYIENSTGDYYTDKAKAWSTKQATSLASGSGLDAIVRQPVNDYYDSYAEQSFKQTSYGDSYRYVAEIEDILNENNLNRSEMFKNYGNMTSAQKKAWKAEWNTRVVKALAPYVQEVGVDNLMSDTKVADYLGSNVNGIIFVSDPWHVKDYLKKIFGGK